MPRIVVIWGVSHRPAGTSFPGRRRMVEGIIYRYRYGIAWRDVPSAALLLATACTAPGAASDGGASDTPRPAPSSSSLKSSAATASPAGTPKDWAETFQLVNSGVAHLAVILCDGGGTGTGFLVGEDLNTTAAHVARK